MPDIFNVEPLIFREYATALSVIDDMNFLIKRHGYVTVDDLYYFLDTHYYKIGHKQTGSKTYGWKKEIHRENILTVKHEQPPFELDTMIKEYKLILPTPTRVEVPLEMRYK